MTLDDLQRRLEQLEAENQLLHARLSRLESSRTETNGVDELVLLDA
jgi:prefoldin subunit 5